ncbi:MAG: hypothetical protein WCH60_16630 [Burkholderiales bacterium]
MDIRQLSVRYHADQDRILVCINTTVGEEVQMWLTRRMATRLWPLINRIVIDHFAIPQDAKTDGYVNLAAMGSDTRKMLADMRAQEAAQTTDFSTPYQGKLANRPLGDTPLLVTEVNLTPRENGQMQMNFKEALLDPLSNRGFQLDMPADLVFGVLNLLKQALDQSQWEIGRESSLDAPILIDEAVDEIDMSPDATRPTYLN